MANSGQQQTKFNYGVTILGNSAIDSNDILGSVDHPDKTTGLASSSERDLYTVDGLGEDVTFQDRNGNVHTYTLDVIGRQTADAVTTLGSGVDGTVRRLETAYDTQGNAYLFTSYDQASGGTALNQVKDTFNGLGQLTAQWQEHGGTVTGSSLEVQYGYTEMAGGVNNSRLTKILYPNGKELDYNYATGVNNNISRLTSLSDSTGTLESYAYLGLDTIVLRSHPQPGIDLTYIKQTGEANGDAGDKYIGLDRFDRVVDQRWIIAASGVATDRFQYGYDRDGNRLYRNNLVNTAFGELYHINGANGYDNLNQMTTFARGTLSASVQGGPLDTIATATGSQAWSLDVMGNFQSQTTNGTQVNRTHNKQNEISTVGANTLTYDNNGNLTTDETGKQLVFDAWNRLVALKSSTGTLLFGYSYDGLGRRITEATANTTDLYYSTSWQVLEERVSGSWTAQYVWSPVYVDALVLRDRPGERYWVQQDANWNVTAILDTTGAVVERYIYFPYGGCAIYDASWNALSTNSHAWRYQFQGGRYDWISLYNFRNRDMSASLGRWVENDPLGFAAGDVDLYRFVANQPAGLTDPFGMDPPWYERVLRVGGAIGTVVSPIGWGYAIFDPQGVANNFDVVFGGNGNASRVISAPFSTSGAISGGTTGAAGGAATGAVVGTFVFPVVGTAAGAVIGAIGGAVGGVFVGGYAAPPTVRAVGGDPNSPWQNALAGAATGGPAGAITGGLLVLTAGGFGTFVAPYFTSFSFGYSPYPTWTSGSWLYRVGSDGVWLLGHPSTRAIIAPQYSPWVWLRLPVLTFFVTRIVTEPTRGAGGIDCFRTVWQQFFRGWGF